MNEHGITKENLLRTFPPGLRGDASLSALAEVVAELLAQRREEMERISIYPHIDRLDESLLDILAQDFRVDWWDNDYSLEEKRRTLQTSWQVHKTLGTKAAVEQAISAIYPHTTVREWFEYGGRPYHFRLDINITEDNADSEKQRRVLEKLQYYKNLRSHLEAIAYFMESAGAAVHAGAAFLGSYQQVGVRLAAPGVGRPKCRMRVHAGAGVMGSYQRITVRVRR